MIKHTVLFIAAILLLSAPGSSRAAAPATAFEPGPQWLDTDGNPINCHGGGFLFFNKTYYWFGEFKVARRSGHIGVACYSSTDLYNWKNNGEVLSTTPDGGDISDGCVIERPKVIFNATTHKFVLWFHLELKGKGYGSARAAIAVSDTPTGPYKYLNSFRPNAGVWPLNFDDNLKRPLDGRAKGPDDYVRRDFAGGQMSRDMNMFVDDDGSAYHIYSSEENQTLQISKLTDDYLKPAGQYVRIFVGKANEAPAMFKRNGKYYLITSGTTGWRPNAARLGVADTITGPWKYLGNPCVGTKDQTDVTFSSQAASVLPVAGKSDAFIYVGDRWNSYNLPDSRYIWLPILFADNKPMIAWKPRWDLSVFDEAKK
jgi:beta-xylosidase